MDNNINNNVPDNNSVEQPTVANMPTQEPMIQPANVISPEDIANTLNPPQEAKPVQEEPAIPPEAANATPVEIPAEGVGEAIQANTPSPEQQVVVDSTVTGAPAPAEGEKPKKESFFKKLFGKKEKN